MFIHHLAGDRAQSDAEEFRPTVYDDNLSLSLSNGWSKLSPLYNQSAQLVRLG